ncbi:MAG TPA: FG-GAP-like repeat-containing protein [Thermoanaerobaculia bacterium]|nr:FG-GAP-like repeat-containing protein [Thermoanaerobaculia bacterium]
MRPLRGTLPLAALAAVLLAAAVAPKDGALAAIANGDAPQPMPREELLQHHRNLGKAFYENPTTHDEAVAELEKALALAPESLRERLNLGLALLRAGREEEGIAQLDRVQRQDPSLPHTWFNLGVAWKGESQYEKALAQFEKMVELVPDEPISHYNLGYLYKLTGAGDKALPHFERAAALDPNFAAPRFQLWNVYRQAGREEDAARVKAEFDRLKELQKNAAVPEDVDWSWYAELYDPPESRQPAAAPGPLAWEAKELGAGWKTAGAGLAVLDADGDRRPDLLAWDESGVKLFSGGKEPRESGLEGVRGAVAVAPGDFDNDGLADLCVLTGGGAPGAALWHNAGGRFTRVTAPLPAGPYLKCLWLDFDHDYDLDLLLLGKDSRLLRNQGADHLVQPTPAQRGEPAAAPGQPGAGWGDETARFPFVAGEALDAAALDLVADSQGIDVAVSFAGRPGVLYRDRLGGRFEVEELPALPAGARGLVAADVDRDGWTDLVSRAGVLLNARSFAGELRPAAGPSLSQAPFALADFGNRGAGDLATAAGVRPDLGGGGFGEPQAPPGFPAAAAAAADYDADGRVDLAALGADGTLRLLANRTENGHRWLAVALDGVKNLKLAAGAEVEVKAGTSFQKKHYAGVPLHFGLGARPEADTVRITWPNGLIQNEPKRAAGALLAFKEAPRLSGSCPMIFTWNGERFEFITDVLGVAPLGASAGDGQYFPVDHDEVIQVPGEALAAVDGRYEVRITEELREVAYLDQVRLLAVDHPAAVEVFTNDKFKGPPFPEFRLFGVERRLRPVAARDHLGNDVLPRLLARDRAYPDAFRRDHAGIAELHHLELDFGGAAPDGQALLVLSGWVDWADGSTFLGAAQAAPGGLVMPYLQVKDERGAWKTVLEDMGIPAGKPKTIVVDLTGKWLSAARAVRIVTSLCVYWDEVFLAAAAGEPPLALAEVPAESAELRFRGFSRPVIHPERKQPESFDYQSWMPVSMWNPTPGLYTRYGGVRELLAEVDDRMVVMGSGDELRLRFDARALPPLPPGHRRDFLLWVDGWAKDGDANTAYSQTVEPLPFHGMSQYPYPESERFPDGPEHRAYRERYNTRPALRLLRPLPETASAAAPPR